MGNIDGKASVYVLLSILFLCIGSLLYCTFGLVENSIELGEENTELKRRLEVSGNERLALSQKILRWKRENPDDYEKVELLEERRLLVDILDHKEEKLRLLRSENKSLRNDIRTILIRIDSFLHRRMLMIPPKNKEACKILEEDIEVKWVLKGV